MHFPKVGRAGALYKLDSPYWEVTSGRVLKLVEHSACACLGVSFYIISRPLENRWLFNQPHSAKLLGHSRYAKDS